MKRKSDTTKRYMLIYVYVCGCVLLSHASIVSIVVCILHCLLLALVFSSSVIRMYVCMYASTYVCAPAYYGATVSEKALCIPILHYLILA